MKCFNGRARWVATMILAAASSAAAAQSTDPAVSVENESFGFESCAALAAVPAAGVTASVALAHQMPQSLHGAVAQATNR